MSKPLPPPGPPPRVYKQTLFRGLVETVESKRARRDYDFFCKGLRFAGGEPYIKQSGDLF